MPADKFGMTKFFDKKTEEELGTGTALQLAIATSELRGKIDTYNAIRRAQGKMTLQEEIDDAISFVKEMVANGEARAEDYPEIFEDEWCGPEEP